MKEKRQLPCNFKYGYLMVIVCIINSIFAYKALVGDFSLELNNGKASDAVIIMSWLGVITLFFAVYTWKKKHNEIISPYIIFYFTLYIYCYGQSIPWIWGLTDFYKDLVLRETQSFIVQAQAYTLPFLSLFHLFALLFSNGRKNLNGKTHENIGLDNKALFTTGVFFLVISTPAFLINLFTTVNLVISHGYSGIYQYKPDYPKFIEILLYIGKFFESSLICILVSKRKNIKIRNLIIVIFLMNIIISLYTGSRNGAVVSLLALVCVWHYIIKPINKKEGFILVIVAYLFVGILNAVAVVRGEAGHGITDIIIVLFSKGFNIIGDFVGEVGWSLTSVGYTIQFIPNMEGFRYGSTYLYGLSTIIPNLGQWDVHPATVNAQLSEWLQNMLGISYGPGYTMIAETYMNFGWFGISFAALEGALIGWLLSRVSRKTARSKPAVAAFIIIFLLINLQLLVRSSFVVAFRDFSYILGAIFIVYMLCRKHYRQKY
ncbi:O-antigen polysaccharide polymerase Wzy family protein [Bacillus mycoides]|uniref:O-antigen polysaccharide polymerase Wzy n=1 Tax=Bacillus mycoides TaxID=1405 RepID=UPI0021120868|nr:O-antigen polysaccharide polymerase Wzy [Bacillus mycoides]MCQ6534397.1 O-antigen polysaccharide polymerase Wzy family protein [Bacillus mycoides]